MLVKRRLYVGPRITDIDESIDYNELERVRREVVKERRDFNEKGWYEIARWYLYSYTIENYIYWYFI